MRALFLALPLAGLTACATMTDGRRQIITISTTPDGAACVVDRLGDSPVEHLDQVPSTPGTVLVLKSNKPLKITCAKQGQPTVQATQAPGVDPNIIANLANGVVIGMVSDAASGAMFEYPSHVHIDLHPKPAPAKPAVTPAAAHGPAPAAGQTAPRAPVTPTPLAPPSPARK